MKKSFHIEVCAGIGVGKSSFAQAMRQFGYTPIHEDFNDNPYLEEFYKAPSPEIAFKKDLWFANRQLEELSAAKKSGKSFIYDTSLLLSRAYIDINELPTDRKEELLDICYAHEKIIGHPDILVALTLPVDIQRKRIENRARRAESAIHINYLKRLNTAIEAQLCDAIDKQNILYIDVNQDINDPSVVSEWANKIAQKLDLERVQQTSRLNF